VTSDQNSAPSAALYTGLHCGAQCGPETDDASRNDAVGHGNGVTGGGRRPRQRECLKLCVSALGHAVFRDSQATATPAAAIASRLSRSLVGRSSPAHPISPIPLRDSEPLG
jgi:hypothetical protein